MIKAEGLPDVGFSSMTTGQRQVELLGKGRLPYFDQDEVHEIYRAWRPILDSYPGGRMAVAEAWAETPQRLARYIGPDELHQAFSFDFLDATWSADSFRKVIDTALAEATVVGAPTTWVLSNHDKQRHVTRYGDGAEGLRRARAASLLMLALPGCAYLYQGEELGLPEVLDLPDELRQDPAFLRTGESRDGCRVPIPWSGELAPYGFGPAGSELSWLPAPALWQALSVTAQTDVPGSTLELYRTALRIRHVHPALALDAGGVTWRESEPGVLAFSRSAGATVLTCVVNFSGAPVLIDGYGHRSSPATSSPNRAPASSCQLTRQSGWNGAERVTRSRPGRSSCPAPTGDWATGPLWWGVRCHRRRAESAPRGAGVRVPPMVRSADGGVPDRALRAGPRADPLTSHFAVSNAAIRVKPARTSASSGGSAGSPWPASSAAASNSSSITSSKSPYRSAPSTWRASSSAATCAAAISLRISSADSAGSNGSTTAINCSSATTASARANACGRSYGPQTTGSHSSRSPSGPKVMIHGRPRAVSPPAGPVS